MTSEEIASLKPNDRVYSNSRPDIEYGYVETAVRGSLYVRIRWLDKTSDRLHRKSPLWRYIDLVE